jgi:hypothetical protein
MILHSTAMHRLGIASCERKKKLKFYERIINSRNFILWLQILSNSFVQNYICAQTFKIPTNFKCFPKIFNTLKLIKNQSINKFQQHFPPQRKQPTCSYMQVDAFTICIWWRARINSAITRPRSLYKQIWNRHFWLFRNNTANDFSLFKFNHLQIRFQFSFLPDSSPLAVVIDLLHENCKIAKNNKMLTIFSPSENQIIIIFPAFSLRRKKFTSIIYNFLCNWKSLEEFQLPLI